MGGGDDRSAASGLTVTGDVLPRAGLTTTGEAVMIAGLTVTGTMLVTFGLTVIAEGLPSVEPVRGTMTGLETTTGPGMTMDGLDMAKGLGLGEGGGGVGEAGLDDHVISMLWGHCSCIPSPAAITLA